MLVPSPHHSRNMPMNPSTIVEQALFGIVCHPLHDEAQISAFFSPHYQQWVDGKSLDYAGFVAHMAKLKQITRAIHVTVLAIASQQENVLTHHRVDVTKADGSRAQIEVFAHFVVQESRILRCEELTRLVAGAAEDGELGSVQ